MTDFPNEQTMVNSIEVSLRNLNSMLRQAAIMGIDVGLANNPVEQNGRKVAQYSVHTASKTHHFNVVKE